MKAKFLLSFSFLLGTCEFANSQSCSCPFNSTQYPPNISFTPTCNWDTTQYLSYSPVQCSGDFSMYYVSSGQTYSWSYCPADGGSVIGNIDFRLNLFDEWGGFITCNGDAGCGNNGKNPKITWAATFTGYVKVQTNRYIDSSTPCDNTSTSSCGYMVYRKECGSCSSPTATVNNVSGSGSVTMTCTASGGSGGSTLYKWFSGNSCSGTVLGTNSTLTVTTSGNYACKAYISGYETTCYDCDFGYATINSSSPANDDCPPPSQYQLTSNTVCNYISGTVSGATQSVGANTCTGCVCQSPDNYDVYYYFTAVSTSHTIVVNNIANNFDAVIELRSACASGAGNVVSPGCYDPSGSISPVSNTWNNLTIGQTYYVRVFEFNYSGTPPSSSTFDICITHTGGCTPPTITVSSTNTTCGNNNGNVSAVVSGGTPGYSYQWDNGCTSSSCNNLSAGTYTVTVTDAGVCTAIASVTVNGSSAGPTPTIIQNGNILSTAQNYSSYQWSTGVTSQSITVSSNGIYYVTVTDFNGCSGSTSFNFTSIGIKEFPKSDIIRIFPNPNNGSFTISVENIESQKISVKIFSVLGEIIYDFKPELVSGKYQQEINLGNVSEGVYFIQTSMGEKTYMNKILKQ